MADGKCAKCLLIGVNLVIALIGLGFFISGVILRFAANIVDGYVDLEALADRIPDFAESVGVLDVNDGKVKDEVANYTGFEVIGLVLLILGLFILITGVLGMCGACFTNKCMLVSYIIIVVIGVLAQLAIVVAFATDAYVTETEKYLKDRLRKDYKGIDSYELIDMVWNYIMLGYGCCGLEDGDDFKKADKWDDMRLMDVYGNGTGEIEQIEFPVACCKTKGSFPDKIKAVNSSCVLDPDRDNNNYRKGCWTKLKEDIEEDMVISAAVVGVFLFFQVICAILAICILVKNRNKADQYA